MTKQKRSSHTITWLVIVFCVGVSVATFGYHARIFDKVEEIRKHQQRSIEVITTIWKSGGLKRRWTSTQKEGETINALAERHRQEVAEMMEEYPVDD